MANSLAEAQATHTRVRLYSAMVLAVFATAASMGAAYLFEPLWGLRFYYLLFIPPVLQSLIFGYAGLNEQAITEGVTLLARAVGSLR